LEEARLNSYVSLDELSGNGLTAKIHNDILPYLTAGNLRAYVGTRLAQIIISEFEPATNTSRIWSLGVDLPSPAEFRLQPLPVTSATTVHGDRFGLESDRAVLPFGEVEYYYEHVLTGPGKAYLSDAYAKLMQKQKISEVEPTLAGEVAVNLIDATSKTTGKIAVPSGIGGGISAIIVGDETTILR
jgi:hypothetical protein